MRDDPVQVKFQCKVVDPCENSRAVHTSSPRNSRTVIEKVQLKKLTRIKSRPSVFQRAINQGRTERHPSLPQNGVQIPKFVVFRRNFDHKPLKACYCYKVSLSKNFQRHICSAIKLVIERYGMIPFPENLGIKARPQQELGCAFHVSHVALCAVRDSRPCNVNSPRCALN